MPSMELQGSCDSLEQVEDRRLEKIKRAKKNKNKKKKRFSYVPRFGCLVSETEQNGSFELKAEYNGEHRPTHLIVMVNGIIGRAANWRYTAKQFTEKYNQDAIVHCSESNYSRLTFDGVDVMGERLAKEVISVIKYHPGLQKISFIGHSLGGVVARYAIGKLYGRDPMREHPQENEDGKGRGSGDACPDESFRGKIAGLEPVNFITCATPHLGSRGHKQVPAFCGFYTLEKVASRASGLLGRTGRHLFLTDSDNGKPLLLRIVNDCEDLKFMSALKSFRRRVAYANSRCDHLVGWCTSSLRRPNELPKLRHFDRNDSYPHIINVETTKTASPQEVPLDTKANGDKTVEMEEKMITALTKVSWERIDVRFSGIKQRVLAHSTIQVKNYWINYEGVDVIQHMIDNFHL